MGKAPAAKAEARKTNVIENRIINGFSNNGWRGGDGWMVLMLRTQWFESIPG
jgi:hypothetical protein